MIGPTHSIRNQFEQLFDQSKRRRSKVKVTMTKLKKNLLVAIVRKRGKLIDFFVSGRNMLLWANETCTYFGLFLNNGA